MAVRLTKPWLPLDAEEVALLGGYLGVYELGNEAGETLQIAAAGGRSLFGLRGVLMAVLAEPPAGVTRFRVEVNNQYTTRYQELLMVYFADHGAYPPLNTAESLLHLGRLHPA